MGAPTSAHLKELGLSADCVEVLQHLWDYLDDQMTPAGAERLRAHIAACDTCRGYEGFQECFLSALARIRAGLAAPGTVREKLAETLKGQGCGCWEKVKREG